MEFWTTLIVAKKNQGHMAELALADNCTHVDNDVWIYEGDIEALEDDGVLFKVIAEGAVPCLGDMSRAELVKLCSEVYGEDIYAQAYKDAGVDAQEGGEE